MINATVLVTDQSADGVMAAWRKLKTYIATSGIQADIRRHEHALTRSQRRRVKAKKSRKRDRKAAMKRENYLERYEDDKHQRRQDGTPIPHGRRPGVDTRGDAGSGRGFAPAPRADIASVASA